MNGGGFKIGIVGCVGTLDITAAKGFFPHFRADYWVGARYDVALVGLWDIFLCLAVDPYL